MRRGVWKTRNATGIFEMPEPQITHTDMRLDIDTYLSTHRQRELLRLLTCGSVDDGKSTLIGRLLFDTQLIADDQLAAAAKASKKHGTQGDNIDLALLVDGLRAEREQGITIDVAYRYFSSKRRKFIIADCPGHEEYTRNMATGASNCDLAIVLIDAKKGVLPQTRRHSFIVSLLGIRHVVVAVNKMDTVDWSEERFNAVRNDFAAFATKLDLGDVRFVPVSALAGDNVVSASARMPWYGGGTLMHTLETVHIASDENLIDLRLPVQLVLRPDSGFRGFAGSLASGVLRKGAEVCVLPSGKRSRVASLYNAAEEKEVEEAQAPEAVTLTLEDEIDVSRGDMLVAPKNRPVQAHRFEAMIVWMHETPLRLGAEYLIKHTTQTVGGRLATLRYTIDINTGNRVPLPSGENDPEPVLELNQIARCEIAVYRPLMIDPYERNRTTGAFVVIDRRTNQTVGAGMVVARGLHENLAMQEDGWDVSEDPLLQTPVSSVGREERQALFAHAPGVLLLTGLTNAGKTTLAAALMGRLFDQGQGAQVILLDGQGMRAGLSRGLGFSATDRSENLRRFSEVARLLADQGTLVIGAFVAPDQGLRERVMGRLREPGDKQALWVHLECPVEVCKERDARGLYERAATGEWSDFPGVNMPYDKAEGADLVLDTNALSVEASVEAIIVLLTKNQLL